MFLFSICGTIISVSLAGWIRSRLADFEWGSARQASGKLNYGQPYGI